MMRGASFVCAYSKSPELYSVLEETVRQACEHEGMHMQETCVTVTLMKFFAKLNLLTGDAKFMDAFERSFYNAYLGSFNTEHNVPKAWIEQWQRDIGNTAKPVHMPLPFDSYSPLTPGTRGVAIGGFKIMPDGYYYGCCACIGAGGVGMLHQYQLPKAPDGYVMNLYINGTAKTDGIMFSTVTEYPKHGKISIKINVPESRSFALYLRNPGWSKHTKFGINGDFASVCGASGYIKLERIWSDGDTVELEFDMSCEVIHHIPYGKHFLMNKVVWGRNYMLPVLDKEDENEKRRISLRRGPIMLAVENRLGKSVDGVFDVKVGSDNCVDVRFPENDKAPFEHILELEIPENNGEYFTVTDYSSAGKTWDDDSRMAVCFFNK